MLIRTLRICSFSVFLVPGHSGATPQFTGSVEMNGIRYQLENPIPLPPGEATRTLHTKGRGCTAGPPQGIWKIEEAKLFMVGLVGCSHPSMQSIYGNSGPIPATWVSKAFIGHGGERLCRSHPAETPVTQHSLHGVVENGVVVSLQLHTHIIDQRVASPAEIKQIFARDFVEDPKLEIRAVDAHCLPFPRPKWFSDE